MMNRKTFIVLAALAAAALLAAVAISLSRRPASEDGAAREYLLPALRGHVNDVTRVSITGAGNRPVAVIERSGDGWKLADRGGYPVDTGKLRRFLLQLADARILERKTALAERHADLGLEDVAGAGAKGLRVEVEGLAEPVRLVVGNASPRGGGTYVRREGEDQTWLVSGDLKPGGGMSRFDMGGGAVGYAGGDGSGATAWLDRELFDLDAGKVAEVRLQRGGEEVRLFKRAAGDEHFTLDGVPKGREPADVWTLDGPGGLLAALSFDDVVPAAEAPPPAGAAPLRARYVTFDGMAVEVEAWKVEPPTPGTAGDKSEGKDEGEDRDGDDAAGSGQQGEVRHYARFRVLKDASRLAAAPARDEAKDDAKGKADGDGTTSAGADAAGPRPAAKDDVDARIARLAARVDGWTYVLPSYKYGVLDKGREDFLKPR